MASKVPPASSASTPAYSMTGYGRACIEDGRRVTAEIRSVNGRFLKVSVKIIGRYGALEDRVKQLLNEAGIRRGSIDVTLFFEGSTDEGNFGFDETALDTYVQQAKKYARKRKLKSKLEIGPFLALPGVVRRQECNDDIEAIWVLARRALEAALKNFNEMRAKEGAAIVADIRAQLAKLIEGRTRVESVAPEALKATVQRFKDRIAKLLEQSGTNPPLNADVLEREVVMISDRTDVSEELARLQSHFQQMEGILAGGGETGKKLDFMTQELFRETNTIGSKTSDDRITYTVVDMKGLIEKIREQVQNLE